MNYKYQIILSFYLYYIKFYYIKFLDTTKGQTEAGSPMPSDITEKYMLTKDSWPGRFIVKDRYSFCRH